MGWGGLGEGEDVVDCEVLSWRRRTGRWMAWDQSLRREEEDVLTDPNEPSII